MRPATLFKSSVRMNNGLEMPMVGYGSAILEEEGLLDECMRVY